MRREERTLAIIGALAAVFLLGPASVVTFQTVRGSSGEPCEAGTGGCSTPEAFSDGVREMPFGPFLFVPPGSAVGVTASPKGPGTTEINDPAVHTASAYHVQLPPPFTRSAITGRASGSDIVEVGADWDGPGGVHVHVTMRKVNPSELPVQVEWLPITSHLFVRQKVVNGRYAVVERPATCGIETGGWVMVWMDGATLTLASSDAPADDLVALVAKITAPGTLY